MPSYVDLRAFTAVSKGEKPVPSIYPGVSMASAIATTQSVLNIVGKSNRRHSPVYAPKALVMDGMTYDSKITSFSRRNHYLHLSKVIERNVLKLNPQTSY